MHLTIIIVSWNVCEILERNLNAIYQSGGDFSFEVFVVDNDSEDNTVAMVREKFPQVKLIANEKNLGFARANNQAMKRAQGEYILLLNPDSIVFPDTLINMINWMREHRQAAVAGCRLVNEAGETIKHVRRFPCLLDQLVIILKLPHLFPNILNKYIIANFDYEQAAEVDSIRGGFFMIRNREDLLFLDERYFLWFEEVDYCREIKARGEQVYYTPVAKCLDHIGQSFVQVGTWQKQKYFRASMLKYFKKWHPWWEVWILQFAWIFGFLLVWVREFYVKYKK